MENKDKILEKQGTHCFETVSSEKRIGRVRGFQGGKKATMTGRPNQFLQK